MHCTCVLGRCACLDIELVSFFLVHYILSQSVWLWMSKRTRTRTRAIDQYPIVSSRLISFLDFIYWFDYEHRYGALSKLSGKWMHSSSNNDLFRLIGLKVKLRIHKLRSQLLLCVLQANTWSWSHEGRAEEKEREHEATQLESNFSIKCKSLWIIMALLHTHNHIFSYTYTHENENERNDGIIMASHFDACTRISGVSEGEQAKLYNNK